MLSPVEKKIWDIIVPCIEDLSLRLVRVKYMTVPKQRSTLQIMVEPLCSNFENRESVDVTECSKVSRAVAAILDVEDPITEAYNLEVSSTGLNRPLVAQEDFTVYSGAKIKIELNQSIDGQKRFTGIVKGFDTDSQEVAFVELETNKEIQISYETIKKANLYYTQKEINELFEQN
ncbi:MAG: ribosome maturation factor RimP [Proteobacteria bacterium]|nr:ribosome maturation factor RimP [Pseudomonadota bacterium]